MTSTQLLIGGQWTAARSGETEEVPLAVRRDGRRARFPRPGRRTSSWRWPAAERGAATWRRTPGSRADADPAAGGRARRRARRGRSPRRSAPRTARRSPRRRGEAGRSGELIRLAAFEGTQLYGDTLPLDANRGTGFDKIGFTVRQPVGVVVAITPFNYPALLVLHKLAPALAAGNAVVLKPARTTPLTALALAACFVDAGLPEGVLSVLTGPGGELGDALVSDPRVRQGLVHRVDRHRRADHPAGRGEEAVPGAGRVLPGRRPARTPTSTLAASAVALGGYVNAGPGVHLGAAGDHAPGDRRRTSWTRWCRKVEAIQTGDPASAGHRRWAR